MPSGIRYESTTGAMFATFMTVMALEPTIQKPASRDICIATSTDFLSWTEPRLIKFVDSPDVPLYTNQVVPYYRAPHLFFGLSHTVL